MICTICILLIGIWVVVQQARGGVVNNAELIMQNIEGTLICSRYGAGTEDYHRVVLYTEEMGLDTKKANEVLESTNFAQNSQEIVYLLYFELDQTCETETWINLEDVTLDNAEEFFASYKFSQTKAEPEDWSGAENISGTIVVNQDKPYLWVRISLGYTATQDTSVKGTATWKYKLQFFGNMRSIVE